jgi:hypothetical protein
MQKYEHVPNFEEYVRYDCIESTRWYHTGDMKLYTFSDFENHHCTKYTDDIEIPASDPKLGSDGCLLPFYQFMGQLTWSGSENWNNYYVIANSITESVNYEIGLYTVDQPSLGFIYCKLDENCIRYSLNSDGSFTTFGDATLASFTYDFTAYGRFIFGIEDGTRYYLVCENCWVRVNDITQQTGVVNYYDDAHTPIQIKWFHNRFRDIYITTTSNLCYYFKTNSSSILVYQPPPGKTYNQVYLGDTGVLYCNTTDFYNYKMYAGVWTPILNIELPECGRISMNPSGINFSGEILNYNGFQFKSTNDVLQILDSDNSPVMTITKGLGIKFNYLIIS